MLAGIVTNKIILELQAVEFFKGWSIETFPESFDTYNFTSELGCLLVRYNGSDYSKPDTLGAVTQYETVEFAVISGLRYLKSLDDAVPVLDEIYKNLTGVSVNNVKIYPHQVNYVGHRGGDVYYESIFKITLPVASPCDKNNVYKFSPFTQTRKAKDD